MKQYIPPKDLQLDKEEKALLEAYDKGELVSRPPTEQELEEFQIAAHNTLKRLEKDKNISIRLSSHDLYALKSKAQTAGVPYQTIIGALIHQYTSGKIKIEL